MDTLLLAKINKPNEKRQYRQTLYPEFICLNLKSTFIENLQIIHPFRELLNSFSQKYMNVPDGTNLISLTVFQKTVT